jgi:nucleoside-diphosphate-sugar epimerase
MSGFHVVVGAGPLGRSVAEALLDRGCDVRLVSRRGTEGPQGTVSVAVDVMSDSTYAIGADVVYQCAQPPYPKWHREFESLQGAILNAATVAGARIVIVDNLYSYGAPAGQVISDSLPRVPETRKGILRKRLADIALEAHADGRTEVSIARASNYFGPGYEVVGRWVVQQALRGKTMRFLGRGDVPHSFSYVPDVGIAVAALGTSDASWGRAWITPVQPPVTQLEFGALVWRECGRVGQARKSFLNTRAMAVLGVMSPSMRELVEMAYEFDEPFVVNSSEFEAAFGLSATPFEEAIAGTVEWYRQRLHDRPGRH